VFRDNQAVEERLMDSMDLEKERGITIRSKTGACIYKDHRINIIDTPGHADFGGEVERVLSMADGALFLVDAVEGPMPQSYFVLRKAVQHNLKVIVVVNKIDKPAARADWVIDQVFDLLVSLNAPDEILDFPVVYASARDGYASLNADATDGNMLPLLDQIVEHMPAPGGDPNAPFQLQVATINQVPFLGRLAIGKVTSGGCKINQDVVVATGDKILKKARITKLAQFIGSSQEEIKEADIGNIVAVAGFPDINIGDTITDPENPIGLPPLKVDPPTISMTFMANDSPFSGQEGEFVTGTQVWERLQKAALSDVALKVDNLGSEQGFKELIMNTKQIYLNHASISPYLPGTKNAMSEFLDQRESNSVRYYPLLVSLSEDIKTSIGQIIDASPHQLSIQPNTATSMSILANGMSWTPSDEIILLEDDFPSTTLPFVALRDRAGVKVTMIPYQDFLASPEQSLLKTITKNTRMIVLSYVGFMSGVRHPIELISKICQQNNILLAVDGTQGIGLLPLSVRTIPIDFLAVSTYKWLMCPMGCAFFYISDQLMDQVQPSIIGWLSINDPARMTSSHIDWATDATKYENGGKPLLALVGARESLRYIIKIGLDSINARTISLANALRNGLEERGFDLFQPNNDAAQSGIVTIKASSFGKRLYDYLDKKNIIVTYRNNMLRFSPHFYQDEDIIHEFFQRLDIYQIYRPGF